MALDPSTRIPPGARLVVTKPACHGDWKTALVRPEEWPMLEPGTVVTFVKKWWNFYGTQIKVRAPNGSIYDLEPGVLVLQDSKKKKEGEAYA